MDSTVCKGIPQKQQTKRPIPQNDQIASIKIDLGWTTSETMRQFYWGIRNTASFHQMSQWLNTKIER